MNLRHSDTLASTLVELLSHHDEEFVYVAYRTLLGRAPDLEGSNYYLGRVRAGISPIEILTQIYLSKEGKSKRINIAGLDKAIKRHQRQKAFLLGPLMRLFGANPAETHTTQQLRRIENVLYRQDMRLCNQFYELNYAVNHLRELIIRVK